MAETGQIEAGHVSRAPAEPTAIVPVSRGTHRNGTLEAGRDSSLALTIPSGEADGKHAPAGGPASHVGASDAHRARLAADPRFAAWAAADNQTDRERRFAEQRELTRTAALSVAAEHAAGRSVDPCRLEWAQQILRANPPLGRPLGTGDHTPAPAHLPADSAPLKVGSAS